MEGGIADDEELGPALAEKENEEDSPMGEAASAAADADDTAGAAATENVSATKADETVLKLAWILGVLRRGDIEVNDPLVIKKIAARAPTRRKMTKTDQTMVDEILRSVSKVQPPAAKKAKKDENLQTVAEKNDSLLREWARANHVNLSPGMLSCAEILGVGPDDVYTASGHAVRSADTLQPEENPPTVYSFASDDGAAFDACHRLALTGVFRPQTWQHPEGADTCADVWLNLLALGHSGICNVYQLGPYFGDLLLTPEALDWSSRVGARLVVLVSWSSATRATLYFQSINLLSQYRNRAHNVPDADSDRIVVRYGAPTGGADLAHGKWMLMRSIDGTALLFSFGSGNFSVQGGTRGTTSRGTSTEALRTDVLPLGTEEAASILREIDSFLDAKTTAQRIWAMDVTEPRRTAPITFPATTDQVCAAAAARRNAATLVEIQFPNARAI